MKTFSKWRLLPILGESTDVESEEEEDEITSCSASQDDKEPLDGGNKPVKADIKAPNQNKQAKPRDDLAMYEKFFPELFEFQVGLFSEISQVKWELEWNKLKHKLKKLGNCHLVSPAMYM